MRWLARPRRGHLAALLVMVTACGIPVDSEPRPIAASTTTNPDQAGSTGTGDSVAFLYFIGGNAVTAISEDLPSRRADDVLNALITGPPPQADPDIVTQIPGGTRLLGTTLEGGVLNVNLSADFNNLVGTGRTLATAQIVLTVTELAGVDKVSISLDGQPTQVFSPTTGDASEVNDCDYVSLLATDDQLDSLSLDASSKRHAIRRRNDLTNNCEDNPSQG